MRSINAIVLAVSLLCLSVVGCGGQPEDVAKTTSDLLTQDYCGVTLSNTPPYNPTNYNCANDARFTCTNLLHTNNLIPYTCTKIAPRNPPQGGSWCGGSNPGYGQVEMWLAQGTTKNANYCVILPAFYFSDQNNQSYLVQAGWDWPGSGSIPAVAIYSFDLGPKTELVLYDNTLFTGSQTIYTNPSPNGVATNFAALWLWYQGSRVSSFYNFGM